MLAHLKTTPSLNAAVFDPNWAEQKKSEQPFAFGHGRPYLTWLVNRLLKDYTTTSFETLIELFQWHIEHNISRSAHLWLCGPWRWCELKWRLVEKQRRVWKSQLGKHPARPRPPSPLCSYHLWSSHKCAPYNYNSIINLHHFPTSS